MRHKKADLSLSINAIVILILAITMLGLGLAFMRNIFGKATTEFQEVSGTVKKQMIDQMKESDKIVELSRPKIELKAGETTQIFMGFKNEQSTPKIFQIVEVLASKLGSVKSPNFYNNTGKFFTNISLETEISCGIRYGNTSGNAGTNTYLELKPTNTTVANGDVTVLPFNVISTSGASTTPGTCIFEMRIDPDRSTDRSDSKVLELTVDVS